MPRPSVKDQRQRELTEAAIVCIARKGLQATTIADVSDEAGLSRGIVNFYFSTKEAMLAEALARLLEGFYETAQKEAAKTDAPLQGFLQAHFMPAICNQKRLSVWLEYVGAAASHKKLAKSFAQYRVRWLEAAEAYGSAEGERLFALLGGLWMHCALAGVGETREQAAHLFAQAAGGTAKPSRSVTVTSAPARKATKAAPSQMDIEDLFARKA